LDELGQGQLLLLLLPPLALMLLLLPPLALMLLLLLPPLALMLLLLLPFSQVEEAEEERRRVESLAGKKQALEDKVVSCWMV
jgi:hypothetical protein